MTSPSGGVDSFGCPTDSSEWSFTPTMISENYQIIQPACVYQGLEKSIAWALAVREGYSRAEATELLGFSEMPMRQMETVTFPRMQMILWMCRSVSSHPIRFQGMASECQWQSGSSLWTARMFRDILSERQSCRDLGR
ncbi:hypothetical protein [Candidatus Villigracilis affinis]|uniref:hypothetical protein n=1 Tax=Candidatus Villigracilis affinis TaxID=3140682 RepID=UPI002A2291B6|nr:hypothetical protein [Anaerolineales bacterium]